jgi:hypothetical protein
MLRRLITFGLAIALGVAVVSTLFAPTPARAQEPRRISVSFQPSLYIFDSTYFGLGNGLGADASLRCEISPDIFFESSLGVFRTQGSGVSVDGLDERLDIVAIFPVLIPYRPIARLGVGFLSTNPVTVTPTQTFRPTQTTFYFIGGAGITKSVLERFVLEAGASFWVTPYKYRIYRFNRVNVSTEAERFIHLEIQLGVSYTF